MNILLINHYAGSPKHGMEFRPYYFARHWVEQGHRVTIVACSHAHVRNQSVENTYHEETIDGIRYVWLPSLSYDGNGVKRVLNIFGFITSLLRFSHAITQDFSPDAVIASSTYPLDIFPAKYLAKKHDAKLVFEVHDLWPLSPVELGGMSVKHPFIQLLQFAENRAYKVADSVVSMLPCAKHHMLEHGMVENKFHYVPNGIDLTFSTMQGESDKQLEDYIDALHEQGKFVAAYAGAHGIANSLETIINAASLDENGNFHFIFVGDGPEREHLKLETEQKGLENVTFWPAIKRSRVHSALQKMDVLIITLKNQPLFRFGVSPNKMFDYMLASKPIIQAFDAGNDLVTEAECGLSITGEDPSALIDAVRKIQSLSADERLKMGGNGHKFVSEHHSYKVLADKFLGVLSL